MERINQVMKILPFLHLGSKLQTFQTDFVKTFGAHSQQSQMLHLWKFPTSKCL